MDGSPASIFSNDCVLVSDSSAGTILISAALIRASASILSGIFLCSSFSIGWFSYGLICLLSPISFFLPFAVHFQSKPYFFLCLPSAGRFTSKLLVHPY
jgi:hypothetical protein